MIPPKHRRDAAAITNDNTERARYCGANQKEEKALRRLETAARMLPLREQKRL